MGCKRILISDLSESENIKESIKSHIYDFSSRTLIHDLPITKNHQQTIDYITCELSNQKIDLAIVLTPGVWGIEKVENKLHNVRPTLCWNLKVANDIKWTSNFVFVPMKHCQHSDIIEFLHEIIF